MPDPARLQADRDRYAAAMPRYRRAALAVAEEIKAVSRTVGLFVRVEGREKSLDSFVKKAISKQPPYDLPWEQTTDKAGARAVVAEPSALQPLLDALRAHWADRILSEQDKSVELEPDELGYSGYHLQVVAPEEDTDTEPVECEVQVRTAAQDAWSSLSHQFLYKPAVDMPTAAKRAMYRLVALVEVFDEEVRRAVQATVDDPSFPQGRLLQDAERAFFQIGTWEFDRALSQLVLEVAVAAVPQHERATYGDTLLEFVRENADRLSRFVHRFGPSGDLAASPRYILGGQPEALVLIERSEHAEMLLGHVVNDAGADVRGLVEPLLAAWGRPLPPSESN